MSAFVYFHFIDIKHSVLPATSISRTCFVAFPTTISESQEDLPAGCAFCSRQRKLALLESRRVPTMSQDAGLFSVRRAREVRSSQRSAMNLIIFITKFLLLTLTFLDSRWHKLQLLYSTARLRHQTLEFDIQSERLSTPPKLSTCTLNLLIPNVPCTRPPSTAIFPTLFLRKQSRGPWPTINCPAKLKLAYIRQRDPQYFNRATDIELCSRECQPVPSTNEHVPESAAEE